VSLSLLNCLCCCWCRSGKIVPYKSVTKWFCHRILAAEKKDFATEFFIPLMRMLWVLISTVDKAVKLKCPVRHGRRVVLSAMYMWPQTFSTGHNSGVITGQLVSPGSPATGHQSVRVCGLIGTVGMCSFIHDRRCKQLQCCSDRCLLLWRWQVVHLDWDKLDSFTHVVVVTPKSISPVCDNQCTPLLVYLTCMWQSMHSTPKSISPVCDNQCTPLPSLSHLYVTINALHC